MPLIFRNNCSVTHVFLTQHLLRSGNNELHERQGDTWQVSE